MIVTQQVRYLHADTTCSGDPESINLSDPSMSTYRPRPDYIYKLPLTHDNINTILRVPPICVTGRDANNKTSTIQTGLYLIIQLGRNTVENMSGVDVRSKSQIRVNVSKEVQPLSGGVYTIQGIIIHTGPNFESGHYVYLWKESNTQWRLFNDQGGNTADSVTAIDTASDPNLVLNNFGYDINRDGYIFLYNRKFRILWSSTR
jgi:hypothetical protein